MSRGRVSRVSCGVVVVVGGGGGGDVVVVVGGGGGKDTEHTRTWAVVMEKEESRSDSFLPLSYTQRHICTKIFTSTHTHLLFDVRTFKLTSPRNFTDNKTVAQSY